MFRLPLLRRWLLIAAVGFFAFAHLLLLDEILRFEGSSKGIAVILSNLKDPVGWFLLVMDLLFASAAGLCLHRRGSWVAIFCLEALLLFPLGFFLLALQFAETFPGEQPDIRVSTDLWIVSFGFLILGSMLPRSFASITKWVGESPEQTDRSIQKNL